MDNKNMGPVYFISLGPVTGSAIGILVSLFIPSLPLAMGVGLGAALGLLIGTMLFNLFNKTDESDNDLT
ncbi:MAG: hypothetical protein JJU01_08845 [Alkalibacterium sp.]|nr:hypothetical protein [Alkalibacterium sp.]